MDYKNFMTLLAIVSLVLAMYCEPTKIGFIMWILIALMNIWR